MKVSTLSKMDRSRIENMPMPYQNCLTKSSGKKIRVLDLHPTAGCSLDPICGALREAPLDDRQSYEALSYVWGTDKPSFPVRFGSATVHVTENCDAVLWRLRGTTRA